MKTPPAMKLRSASVAALLPILFLAAAALATFTLAARLPTHLWSTALLAPNADDAQQMYFHYSALPRLAVSLIAGAMLGLTAALLQNSLQNPLADPATLGISSAAHLALAIASLWFSILENREIVAFLGSSLAGIVVLGLSGRRMSPMSALLAGLIVNFFCSSVSSVLTILNFEYLTSLFLWGAGSLVQNDWSTAAALLPRLALGWCLSLALARSLSLLQLGEETTTSLGSSSAQIRILSIILAMGLSASVVSFVGIIGFVGLAGALAARATTSTIRGQMIVAPLWGAALLFCADQTVQAIAGARSERIPTGIATATLGAVLLLLTIARRRSDNADVQENQSENGIEARAPSVLFPSILVTVGAIVLALTLGRGETGWLWNLANDDFTWTFRAPRVLAALSAGGMLAVAGLLIQRVSNNPLAGPEVMGVSSGAALGALMAAFLPFGATRGMQIGFASTGALSVLILMLFMARRHAFAPDRLILIGISLGAFLSAIISVMVVAGDPRAVSALSWLAGSTYRVTMGESIVTLLLALLLLAPISLIARWLVMLPLGKSIPIALGMPLAYSRFLILMLAAALCAISTIVVGPLTFIGTMAPHLARALGMRRPVFQVPGAAAIGATLMVLADWVGRNMLFPWEVPGGLVAVLIGGPYFIWLLRRPNSSK